VSRKEKLDHRENGTGRGEWSEMEAVHNAGSPEKINLAEKPKTKERGD